jgi:hypothetical protein
LLLNQNDDNEYICCTSGQSYLASIFDRFCSVIIIIIIYDYFLVLSYVYIVWPTNKTGNDEVQFRASTDGGTTFADKINLSNTTDAESQDVEIAADGDNVIITWWERNQTAEEPIAWISTDNGETFGPLLKLAMNGTIGESE